VYPSLNEYRSFVIRDFGYWAFCLVALAWFLRYLRAPRVGTAVAWGASIVLATLFRIEGLVILVLLPFALLLRPGVPFAARCGQVAAAQAVLLTLLCALAAWTLFGLPIEQTGRLTEPIQWVQQFGRQLTGGFQQKAAALGQAILNQYSTSYAMWGVLAVLLVILVGKTIGTLTPLYTLLALHAWRGRLGPLPAGTGRVLGWLVLVQTAILVGFLANNFFLTGRFAMAWALTVMLLVPFSLVRLHELWLRRDAEARRKRWLFPAVCAVLLVMAVDGLTFGSSKAYIRDAGLWLKERAPAEAKIHSNSRIVTFYAAKRGADWARGFTWEETAALLQDGSWRNYDYLAVAVDRKHPERAEALAAKLGRAPAARFDNGRGDQVLVFGSR
jgi:hypothetical protein